MTHDAMTHTRPGVDAEELPKADLDHYRDGILLAPITAQVMTDLILVKAPHHNLGSFAPVRFS